MSVGGTPQSCLISGMYFRPRSRMEREGSWLNFPPPPELRRSTLSGPYWKESSQGFSRIAEGIEVDLFETQTTKRLFSSYETHDL